MFLVSVDMTSLWSLFSTGKLNFKLKVLYDGPFIENSSLIVYFYLLRHAFNYTDSWELFVMFELGVAWRVKVMFAKVIWKKALFF